ncbi:MAG: PLP-dependent aminotransferase family protein [Polyangiaceae bacterium]
MAAPERVAAYLRTKLRALTDGEAIPSVRALVAELSVSPLTVQKAFAILRREGLVEPLAGRGTFRVAPSPAAPAVTPTDFAWQALPLGARPPMEESFTRLVAGAPPGAASLVGGYPDETLQPQALLARAAAHVARRGTGFRRQPTAGNADLAAWFAAELTRGFGAPRSSSDILVTSGGQAALTTVFRALAIPGAPALVDSPTYVGALAALRAAGMRPIPVPTDREGVLPDALAAAFARTNASVYYAQPTFANPTGASLSFERRRAVLEVAARARAFVVEDDYARDLALEGQAPAPLVAIDPAHVIHVRSLTKVVAPGLRVAAVSAHGPVRARLLSALAVSEPFVSGLLQEIALELVTSPGWQKHLARLTDTLRARRDLCLSHLARWKVKVHVEPPLGGYTLWVRLPDSISPDRVARLAARADVAVMSGASWFAAEALASFLRVSFFGAPIDVLGPAMATLGRAVERAARPTNSR